MKTATLIENKKALIADLKNALPYADGPNYHKDLEMIAIMQQQVRDLESQTQ